MTQCMPDGCSSTDSLRRVLANPVRVRCIMKTDLRTSQASAFCSTPICKTLLTGSQRDKAQVRKEQGRAHLDKQQLAGPHLKTVL